MGSSPKGSGELHAGCRTLQRIRRLIVLGAETAFLIRFSHSHLHRLGAGGAVAKAPCERRTGIRKDRLMAAQWTQPGHRERAGDHEKPERRQGGRNASLLGLYLQVVPGLVSADVIQMGGCLGA